MRQTNVKKHIIYNNCISFKWASSFHDAGYGKTLIVFRSDEWNLEKRFGIKICLGNGNTMKDKNPLLTDWLHVSQELSVLCVCVACARVWCVVNACAHVCGVCVCVVCAYACGVCMCMCVCVRARVVCVHVCVVCVCV
jgi:hypothetical protein